MNKKRILGIVLIVIGVGLLCASFYISAQVDQGKGQITDAQGKVDTTNSLFSLSPSTKSLGGQLTGGAQKKINEGWEDVRYYEALARTLKIAGLISTALGVLVVIVCRKKR